ncbi:hypothetical protein SPBR_07132 [Sporothrix brasiliensis 5110]|uniref:Uncharacterized protein n=1 Tax=Sporothrix brasiliensis 5110 TaxID=1398154 RepID=A0A0C2IW43_9PEZI|nr:uncharacterized protein SPBR_07132 [Sporothrix brasiliensis 5110]KIH89182.1 hypothetical protein SPBR_07132 [Sporothrix brasiliensis 5110]
MRSFASILAVAGLAQRLVSASPSVAIWSTYTSVDLINSVTHTTTKQITTTTTTKFTKTTTTALSTTTSTTTTMTTTRNGGGGGGGHKRFVAPAFVALEEDPQPQTIVPSETPEYAGVCLYVNRYSRNCISLGATPSITTIVPPSDSEVLSSTKLSTASADVSVYASTTRTKTTITTLPSLHSTTTAIRTSTTVISTSTSTTYTKTDVQTTKAILTSTIGTTTTTTTKATASPTPYLMKVASQSFSSGSAPNVVGAYVDWITPGGTLALSSFPYSYALGFVDGVANGNLFVVTAAGDLAVIVRSYPSTGQVNTQLVLTVVDGGYVVPTLSPAAGTQIVSCTLNHSGSTASLVNCNYNLYTVTWTSTNGKSLTIMVATQDPSPPGQLTFQLAATSY